MGRLPSISRLMLRYLMGVRSKRQQEAGWQLPTSCVFVFQGSLLRFLVILRADFTQSPIVFRTASLWSRLMSIASSLGETSWVVLLRSGGSFIMRAFLCARETAAATESPSILTAPSSPNLSESDSCMKAA